MSKENVRQFYNHLASDIVLQERFKEMNARLVEGFNGEFPDGKHMDEIFQHELLPVAMEAGFEFSLEDLKEYAAEAKETGELADLELAAVVGGTEGTACVCVIGGYGASGGQEMVCVAVGSGIGKVEVMFCCCVLAGGGTHY